MRALKTLVLALVALACAAAPATAQIPATASEPPPPPPVVQPQAALDPLPVVDANYVLGVGDVVEITVVGRTDYNTRVRVSPDGNVLLPLIGNILAVNLRPGDLAAQVAAGLAKGGYYSQPVVRVEVVTVASRFVTVLGQVGSPGLIPLDRTYRLSEILAKVGARFGAGGNEVIITRGNGTQVKLNMNDIATGDATKDPAVVPGDKIYVPAAEAQVFYISGSVRSPGAFPLSPGLTVRTGLALAGGISETGNEKKFEIFRNGVKIPRPTLETEVQVGDIIKFGERMF